MSGIDWKLEGRTFVVTGASSGMGEETAKFLGKCKANVVLQGRDSKRLKTVADQVVASGGKALIVELDLEDVTNTPILIDKTVAEFGEIDGLVLNASIFEPIPFADVKLESITRQWNTNVVSHYLIAQRAVPKMKKGSSIVFVSSTTAHVGFATCSAYAATKGAVNALARTLAIELAPNGIRVNTIEPGFVKTPMLIPILEAYPGYEESLLPRTAVGRLGQPEEIGATIAFLLSGLAPYINGVTLPVDGGWTAS